MHVRIQIEPWVPAMVEFLSCNGLPGIWDLHAPLAVPNGQHLALINQGNEMDICSDYGYEEDWEHFDDRDPAYEIEGLYVFRRTAGQELGRKSFVLNYMDHPGTYDYWLGEVGAPPEHGRRMRAGDLCFPAMMKIIQRRVYLPFKVLLVIIGKEHKELAYEYPPQELTAHGLMTLLQSAVETGLLGVNMEEIETWIHLGFPQVKICQVTTDAC